MSLIQKVKKRFGRPAKNLAGRLGLDIQLDSGLAVPIHKLQSINNLNNRKELLESLSCVDEVISFDEDTPYNLIKAIKPHILAKGEDYKGEKVIGEDIVEELKLVEFVNGKSSTLTIEKIQQGK